MKTLEQRIEALEAKAGIVQEPWKPSKPTLCWVDNKDKNNKEKLALIDQVDAENYYYSVNSICWVFATPLTRVEVMEYLEESKPVEKRCATCKYKMQHISEKPCNICCESGAKGQGHYSEWKAASSLEARPE